MKITLILLKRFERIYNLYLDVINCWVDKWNIIQLMNPIISSINSSEENKMSSLIIDHNSEK